MKDLNNFQLIRDNKPAWKFSREVYGKLRRKYPRATNFVVSYRKIDIDFLIYETLFKSIVLKDSRRNARWEGFRNTVKAVEKIFPLYPTPDLSKHQNYYTNVKFCREVDTVIKKYSKKRS